MIDAKYSDYAGMIKSLSRKIAAANGVDGDDVEAQANLIFCECRNAYRDGTGAAFGTYLYSCLRLGLYKYARKCRAETAETCADETELERVSARVELYESILENFSRDARTCAEIALADDMPRQRVKTHIRARLHDMGWNRVRIYRAFNDVRTQLQQI